MALKLGSLQVDIGANTSGLKKAGREVENLSGKMGRSFSRLGGIIAAAFSIEIARKTLVIADQMKLLDVRIKNATRSTEEFNKARQRLISLSAETGSQLANNVKLFEALTMASQELGATSDQVLDLTGALNKLGVVGGSSSEQMGNAMLQLSQAMAGGIVRAEEFNSILENTPMIAKAIADGLGKSTGELRKMVLEGELLSEDVFNSILKQTDKIQERFETMPVTIERASAQMSTNFQQVVREIDKGVNATGKLANVIVAAANLLLEVPNIIRVGFVGVIATLEQEWVSFVASIEIDFLRLQKALTFSDEGENLVQGKIEAIEKERDARIKASKDALDSIIDHEVKLRNEKFKTFDVSTGASTVAGAPKDTGPTDAEKARAAKESARQEKIAQERIEKIKLLNETEREEVERLATDMRTFILSQDQLLADERASLLAEVEENRLAKIKSIEEKEARAVKKAADQTISVVSAANQSLGVLRAARLTDDKKAAKVQAALGMAENISQAMKAGFPQNLPFIAGAIAQGNAITGLISNADKFEDGGIVNGSSFTGDNVVARVNSGEMILNRGQQSKLFSMANGDNSSGNGSNITINNNAGAEVSATTMSDGQIMIEIDRARKGAVNDVNQSLATGRGSTYKSLQQSTKVERNIR